MAEPRDRIGRCLEYLPHRPHRIRAGLLCSGLEPVERERTLTGRADALTARAERAEAAEADLRATVERVRATWRYIADTMATSSRDWSETATDAWLYGAIVGWGDGPDDPDEAWTAMAAVWWDADDVAQLKEIHATLAALDAQRPAEGGPEPAARVFRRCTGCGDDIWPEEPGGDVCAICRVQTPPPSPPRAGRFEELLAGEHEQFDQRMELLKSITEYMDAPSGTVSTPPPSPEGEGAAIERLRAEVAGKADAFANLGDRPTFDQFAAAEKALRDARAVALDGGQPDTPAPTEETS